MRRIMTTLAILAITLGLASCGGPTHIVDPSELSPEALTDINSTIETIESADELRVEKALVSIGDKWTIYVDDEAVAYIHGEAIYLIGDTYSMYTMTDNYLGCEGEELRLIKHRAELYDYGNAKVGEIHEEVLSLLYKFYIYDAKGAKVGTADQNFSLTLSMDIRDTSGTNVWHISEEFFSLNAKLTVTRKADNDISAMDAIWMAVIANEIAESRSASNDTSQQR